MKMQLVARSCQTSYHTLLRICLYGSVLYLFVKERALVLFIPVKGFYPIRFLVSSQRDNECYTEPQA